MGIKQWATDFKKDLDKMKEIKEIKKESYYKAMRKQATVLGEEQARLETEHRAKVYKKKLEEERKNIKKKLEEERKNINNPKKSSEFMNFQQIDTERGFM